MNLWLFGSCGFFVFDINVVVWLGVVGWCCSCLFCIVFVFVCCLGILLVLLVCSDVCVFSFLYVLVVFG